jgi:Carboxypeptidase regulatory-like domain
MTPFRKLGGTAALAFLLLAGSEANAAWNNVFQVCCDSCRNQVTAGYAAVPAVPVSDPGQPCTTRYVQRSYYQPVTTYQQRTYYEPVTSYRTSYYYEPVTSYRISNYPDPCGCGCQQVATPVTSYRLRSQCSPVTSYLQRTMVQPVTGYQLAYYYEPQTTCCQTTIGAPIAAPPPAAVAVPVPAVQGGAVAVPAVPAAPTGPPTVGEQRQQLAVPPGVSEQREQAPSTSDSQRYPAPASSTQPMPRAPEGSTFRPAPVYPPSVRLDRIVSASSTNLQGQVVNEDSRPVANVKLLFVPADQQNARESTTADASGKFQVDLEPGTWLVYTVSSDGKSDFRRKLEVGANQPSEVRLVSR